MTDTIDFVSFTECPNAITGVSVVSPRMGELGWPFASADEFPAADKDPLYDSKHVRDLYFRANAEYKGR